MCKFIKLLEIQEDEVMNTIYFNIDSITTIHEERCLVYTANDIHFITPESMEKLIQFIGEITVCQE